MKVLNKNIFLICGIPLAIAAIPLAGDCQTVGIFTGKASVGDDGGQGDALFSNETYEVKGSGGDIGGVADGFFWAYKEISGNFLMQATLRWGAADAPVLNTTESVQSKKMGIMVRETANDPASRHVFAMLRREYGADIGYRLETGGASAETPGIVAKSPTDTDTILLFRSGSTFSLYRKTELGYGRFIGKIEQPNLPNAMAAGLAVTSHSATMVENAFISDVSITPISGLITAARSTSKSLINPGETVNVQITLDAGAGAANDAAVLEVPPPGYTVSNIKTSAGDAALNKNGDVEWVVKAAAGKQTLTYDVTAPATAGTFQFEGVVNVDNLYVITTYGDTLLAVSRSSSGKNVAMFRKFAANSLSDHRIALDLQTYFGVAITEYDDANVAGLPTDLESVSMAYISETVTSANIRDKNYQAGDTPVILGEQMLMDDFTFQLEIGLSLYQDNQIEIVDNNHPITRGFNKGILPVVNGSQYLGYFDNPPAGVRILAIAPGNPSRARLWVIEKGKQVNGVTVNGLRIGTFLAGLDGYASNAYADLTDSGRMLMLHAFAYGLGEQPPFSSSVGDYMLYQ